MTADSHTEADEISALEARLDALRQSHSALAARVDGARARAVRGVPLAAFLPAFAWAAVTGAVLGVLGVELAKILP